MVNPMRPGVDRPPSDESTFAQSKLFLQLLARTQARDRLMLFAALIVAVLVLNAIAQVRLNAWQGGIYDAIAQKELSVFYEQLLIFGAIVIVLLLLGVSQTWLHEMLKVKLRSAVTIDLLDEWLKPKRAYRLPLAGDVGVHPDQRIQDDARRLTELTTDLGVGLAQSSLLLLSFIGVLWVLSAQVVFAVDGGSFSIPGYMVWCALAYAIVGSYFTYRVGRPLIQANADLRAREADFRFLLVRMDESAEAVAIHRGEPDERHHLGLAANQVFSTMRKIARSLANLNWVTASYGWIGIIAPIALAAPGYFSGTLSLGGLIMVVGAFYQVQQALRWYVDRFPGLAEWRAALFRVMSYRTALTQIETLGREQGVITYTDHPEGKLSLDGFCVSGPAGHICLPDETLEVAPGERILIAGTPRSGKTTFFRALAGLWIWGAGTLRLPRRGSVMFLLHRPYLPIGSLREAITYPHPPNHYSDADVESVLARIRLNRLLPSLDKVARWDQELTLDEQQRIAFARALLQKPDWIIQDEAMSEMDEDNRRLLQSAFQRELADTALIGIGKRSEDGSFYDRTLTLQTHPPALAMPLRLHALAAAS
jgi:putative ATP-binding cassette transporter